MNRKVIAADLTAEDVALIQRGDYDTVAERMGVLANQIRNLVANNPDAIELIQAARAEYEEWCKLRLSLMVPDALDALDKVMADGGTAKTANARVKAAETIMDRTFMPKQRQVIQTSPDSIKTHRLPDLNELVDQAASPDEAMRLVQRHKELINEIEALRRGAKEIIDVQPQSQEES